MARRPRSETAPIDVVLQNSSPELVGAEIVGRLAVKGFCVVDPCLASGTVEKALTELKDFEALGRWQKVNRAVQEGLLGQEGSSLVAELESPDLDEEVRSDGEMLMKLDFAITDIGFSMENDLDQIGFQISHRSLAMVHQAGEPAEDPVPLTEKQVMKWLAQFLRHRVMVLIFLGPTTGTLELKPYETADTNVYEVPTTPGTMVILRPDLMSHRHFAPGRAFALSSFFLTGHLPKRTPQGPLQMIPAARELDEWSVQRLRQLKEYQKDDAVWDPEIPRDWQHAMNHMYHKGQMIAVRGTACKMAKSEVPEDFWRVSTSGPDYATEVPLMRWDHSQVYDADLESWRSYKSYCKHGVFMDGIELFDAKMFSMTPNEAKSTDPHQRLILEVGYSALHAMGMRKNTLVNNHCGVYVGCGNTEWNLADKELDFGAFGATGGALSISSGRFSFTLGLKGPCMTLDTEGSSGATAVYLGAEACQRKGKASCNEMSCCIAAHVLLTAVWWPSQCASGWLAPAGRCLSFDSTACGYIRSDGVAAVAVKALNQVVDGQVVSSEDEPLVGSIAGAMMNNNGRGASLAAPHGPAEQEAIAEAVRNAGVSPFDVDSVEAHGAGALLSDAIEVGSLTRGFRSEENKDPIAITSVKSSIGNQVEVGALAGFIKALYATQWGAMTPNLHLRQANPHLDVFEQPYALATECLEYRMQSTFAGVMSRGFGGSNVFLLAWGQLNDEKVAPPPGPSTQESISYWPGGGGKLDQDMRPEISYKIVGSFSGWNNPQSLEADNDGSLGFTLTLGENRWEMFQIWLDGDADRVLHPGYAKAPKETPVLGPDDQAEGCNWIIDGRSETITRSDGTVQSIGSSDRGVPGDRYRVRLHIVGKWRTVTWEKLPQPLQQGLSVMPAFPRGSYFIMGSFNDWALEDMSPDPAAPDNWSAVVACRRFGVEFQIARNADWNQVFYPGSSDAPGDGSGEVLGPDDLGGGLNWYIAGLPGDQFRIEFTRVVEGEQDIKKVSWQKVV